MSMELESGAHLPHLRCSHEGVGVAGGLFCLKAEEPDTGAAVGEGSSM